MTGHDPIAIEAQMLIRRPVAEVFEAFVDPAITTQFWFTKSSGRLGPGARVRWDWEMYGVGDEIKVIDFQPNRRILAQWQDDPTTVEWTFESQGDSATLVKIINSGFTGDLDTAWLMAADAKAGYSLVLAGLKAWLEHGIALNLVGDQFPAS